MKDMCVNVDPEETELPRDFISPSFLRRNLCLPAYHCFHCHYVRSSLSSYVPGFADCLLYRVCSGIIASVFVRQSDSWLMRVAYM